MRTKSRSLTTIDLLPNPHPGEILLAEFLQPMALSQTALARAISVPPGGSMRLCSASAPITADTDLRLARYFGMSEGFFIGLQTGLRADGAQTRIGDKLKAIRPRAA